jgi:hypothetical protein
MMHPAKTGAEILEDEIRNFAEVSLNGWQVRDSVRPEMYGYPDIISKIKNVIKLAHNVAMSEGVPLRADHIGPQSERVFYTRSWIVD